MRRLLWLCTHRTQWREEVPLLLDAGIEVVPARHGHREFPAAEQPDDPYFVQTWRRHCTLPATTVEKLRAVNWFHEAPPGLVSLAAEAFDAVLVTSFADSLLLVASWFPGTVLFRVFGHGGLTTYTEVFGPDGLRQLCATPAYREGRYRWCPILPTLSYTEDSALTRNELMLEPFVSPERLPGRWRPDMAHPYVAVVLSRIAEVADYGLHYRRLKARFQGGAAAVPLRFLGKNAAGGGSLLDPEIVGELPEDEFYRSMAEASAFFYQGDSVCHLHWSVLEALTLGVPVVMLQSGYLARALQAVIGPGARGCAYGIVEGLDEARGLLSTCVADRAFAAALAERQRPLARHLTDRSTALAQYRQLHNLPAA